MFIEAIATNMVDCQVLNKANNVDRIELCTDLKHGGFTPPYDVIEECCAASAIPIRVMTRHSHLNFHCDRFEFDRIKNDISFIKTTKADGIVTGIVSKNNEIDINRMKELIDRASPLKVTFHRAFDVIEDKMAAIKILRDLNISTVLTQGGVDPILNNLNILNSLRGFNVQIQGGCGINIDNYRLIASHCDSIHIGSAIRIDNSWDCNIDMNKLILFK